MTDSFPVDIFFDENGSKEYRLRRYRLLIFLFIFCFFFGLYLYNQRLTTRWIYWFDDWVFFADSSTYYSSMKDFSIEGELRKHPLYSVILHPLMAGIKWVFGLKTRQAAKAIIALTAALNISLVFLLLCAYLDEMITALLFTCLYGVLFTNLVFFSIPESYSLSNLGIVVFFMLAIKFHKRISLYRSILLGLTAGIGALLNPPLGLLLFSLYALCIRQHDFRQFLRLALWAGLTALLVFIGTNFLLFGFDYIEHSRKLVNRWAAFSNYLSFANWLNVVISFFIFSVISPLKELERSIKLGDIQGYFRSPVTTVVFSVFISYLGYALFQAVRRTADRLSLAFAAWLAVIYLFYIYFNPAEAFLYSCQVQVPFMMILARAFREISWKWKSIPLCLFVAGVAYINLTCFQG